jgi:hypothetical protein
MPNRKLSITLGLLEQLSEQDREPWDQALITWWANIRPEGGLRLTRHGYAILHERLKLQSWCLDLSNQVTGSISKRLILDLDHKLEWPYYLDFNPRKKTRRIVFFGSREAMMATMYGDLEKWLSNL